MLVAHCLCSFVVFGNSLLGTLASSYYWAGKNGDLLRTGYSEYGKIASVMTGEPAWSYREPGDALVRAAPLIDDKKNIYLATIRGVLIKFSPDGEVIWWFYADAFIPEVPCLYNGAVYITNMQGIVTAVDMESGKARWQKSALGHFGKGIGGDTWSMTAAQGIVTSAVMSDATGGPGSTNDILVGLNADTGTIMWSYKAESGIYNTLQSIKGDSLIFSDMNGRVYCLNLKTGEEIWKAGPGRENETIHSSMSTGGTIVGPNGIVYTTSNTDPFVSNGPGNPMGSNQRGYITAFASDTGKLLWRKLTHYAANNAAAVGMINGRLTLAIGVGTNPDLPIPFARSLGIGDNSSWRPVKKARVLALDAATGQEYWRYELPKWHGWAANDTLAPPKHLHVCLPDCFGNAAIAGDGTVYVGNEDGHFYGIRDKNDDGVISADEVMKYQTHNAFQGSPGIAPGMIVATPCNGMHVFKGPEDVADMLFM